MYFTDLIPVGVVIERRQSVVYDGRSVLTGREARVVSLRVTVLQ